MTHPYRGVVAALTTKHGKESAIAPALAVLGISIDVIDLDTDQLGTFSPEIARLEPQRETVIRKARWGMSAAGYPYGLASEASIGSDPAIPFLNSTLESIAWIDDVRGFEIVVFHRSLEVIAIREEVKRGNDLEPILARADFPNHGLIVYKTGGKVFKGLRNRAALESALEESFADTAGGPTLLESDLRAHMSPSRQKAISQCAELLAVRLSQRCPACDSPGYGEVERIYGAPCRACGNEVASAVRGVLWGCALCENKEERNSEIDSVSPGRCNFCNP